MNGKWYKLGAIVTAFSISLSVTSPVLAEIPHGYWAYQEPMQQAVSAANHGETIRLGKEILAVFEGLPDTDQNKKEICYNTYSALYPAYEALGDYDNAISCLNQVIHYGSLLEFADAVKLAEARIKKIDPMTEVYALTQNAASFPYFGMKHEPKNGAYYGRVYSPSSQAPFSQETAVSFYVNCLEEEISSQDSYIKQYDDGNRLIHVALNMPQENTSLSSVLQPNADAYLNSTMQYLSTLKGPVLLRIGAEMNVWQNAADPELYKQAYLKIAEKARQLAPNVALVFSPNDISAWDVDIDSFYPGDTYVDWVGVSLYTNQFKNPASPVEGTDFDEMYYGNGKYANPITKLRDIVERYGNKKPIIITECGMGYEIKGQGINLTDFAKNRLQLLYSYATMVYPQIKAVIYFDTDVAADGYRYSLSQNTEMMAQYQHATEQNKSWLHSNSPSYNYVKAGNYQDNLSTVQLSTYCNLIDNPSMTVTYTMDGATIASVSQVPYHCEIPSSSIAEGSHELNVTITSENGYQKIKLLQLTKNADGTITIINK